MTNRKAEAAEPGSLLQPGKLGWPSGYRAALLLFFDDGMPCQLDYVIPALKERQLTGDFYLCPGADWYQKRREEWEDATVYEGIDYANHTWRHCGAPDREGVESEIARCSAYLRALRPAADDVDTLSYASPGGLKDGQWGIEPEELETVLKRERLVPRPRAFRRCAGGDLNTYQEMVSYVEQVLRSGGGDYLSFHGVEKDWLTIPFSLFEQILDVLVKYRDELWVPTHMQYLRYLNEQ